jgi:hypothetical protein
MAEINLIPNTLPTPPNISELSRRSGYSRATVRQRLRQGWHPDDFLPVEERVGPTEIRQECHDVATPVANTATPIRQGAAHTPVDLVQLRREIAEWARLHRQVERIKVRQRRNQRRDHISGEICRFTFLGIGVGFFVLLAFSAM